MDPKTAKPALLTSTSTQVPSLTTIIRLAVALDRKVMDLGGAFAKTNLRAMLPK